MKISHLFPKNPARPSRLAFGVLAATTVLFAAGCGQRETTAAQDTQTTASANDGTLAAAENRTAAHSSTRFGETPATAPGSGDVPLSGQDDFVTSQPSLDGTLHREKNPTQEWTGTVLGEEHRSAYTAKGGAQGSGEATVDLEQRVRHELQSAGEAQTLNAANLQRVEVIAVGNVIQLSAWYRTNRPPTRSYTMFVRFPGWPWSRVILNSTLRPQPSNSFRHAVRHADVGLPNLLIKSFLRRMSAGAVHG
jgi:hypothetical protein